MKVFFHLRMVVDGEDGQSLETKWVAISVEYADDAERPTVGSLKMTADLSEEDLENLIAQCQVFYVKVLREAVRESFMD